jgi:CheY-like chemotaxis protein
MSNIKLLLVEDMPLNQLLMKTMLDDFDFKYDIAANGKIAIEKLQQNRYDIILMDLQMPVMNGFEATGYIRNTMHSSIGIIALTADTTTVGLNKCKAVGMNDYVSKPVDETILYNKIINLFQNGPKTICNTTAAVDAEKKQNCTDLTYLNNRTKSNPKLMMEMIGLYLLQTPPLVLAMQNSMAAKDWDGLQAAAHKMIPSFSIMGMCTDFEAMARKVKDCAQSRQPTAETADMVLKIADVCNRACVELKEVLNTIKNTLHER